MMNDERRMMKDNHDSAFIIHRSSLQERILL